jgi:DNA-binding transcriptional regulator GbsR (MarR family)
MDRATAIFVDGIGAAAATSGILTQLQGRIFGLLYLQEGPLALDEIATELEQSKSNISVNVRGLVDWHLVRRVPVGGSRKDHYEAATDFWRVLFEILERRYRFNVRQVLVAVDESKRAGEQSGLRTKGERERLAFIGKRLQALGAFFTALDTGMAAFTQGRSISSDEFKTVPLVAVPHRQRN